jgi:hypothetical protein
MKDAFQVIKNILDLEITRQYHPEGWLKSTCSCIDSSHAILHVNLAYPELSEDVIFSCIGKHISIINGTLFDFIGGKHQMARELSELLSK